MQDGHIDLCSASDESNQLHRDGNMKAQTVDSQDRQSKIKPYILLVASIACQEQSSYWYSHYL